MSDARLPAGLRDRLPGEAAAEARLVRTLVDVLEAAGYARVAPPLAEFEDTLARRLKGARTDLARFVDPLSQRTLAIRSDITPQVARIVATELATAPRPLCLSYAGTVLKLGATALAPDRERWQVGAERVGDDTVEGAIEVARLAVAALAAGAVAGVTVDLTLPDLVDTLAGETLPAAARATLDALLDMKDAGGLAAAGFADWQPLLAAIGPVGPALAAVRRFDRAGRLASRLDGIDAIADALAGAGVRVTLDPTERHGFEYQRWWGFSLFADHAATTVGRGGSYFIAHDDGREEPATGFSLYPDDFPRPSA